MYLIKQPLIPGRGDDNEEQLLWIDLFASLFLFMSLMVTNHTADPVTRADAVASVTTSDALPPVKLFLTEDGGLHLHSTTGALIQIDELPRLIASSDKPLVLVGSKVTDGVLVFETLQKLQASGVSVKYLAY